MEIENDTENEIFEIVAEDSVLNTSLTSDQVETILANQTDTLIYLANIDYTLSALYGILIVLLALKFLWMVFYKWIFGGA